MTYLLDTHIILWLLGRPNRVPEAVRSELDDPDNELLVSAASALEIGIKVRRGKLREATELASSFPIRIERLGASSLPITVGHALLAGSMPWHHRDPFDRILVAQASIEGATLVTVDRAMAQLPAPSILTW